MGINMSYCRFMNTSQAMQEIIDKMYEEDFDPAKLAPHEKQAYDALYDQCETIKSRLDELEYSEWDDDEENHYDPEYGDQKICECGHEYYRHFDSYDDMRDVGCKYCNCNNFKKRLDEE